MLGDAFYAQKNLSIVPTGFYCPGKISPAIYLHAQNDYLVEKRDLTERVKN
jgi:hypothetical protein